MNHNPKNIIYFGVSGTGKTYQLQQLMATYTDTIQQDNILANTLRDLSWCDVICLVLLQQKQQNLTELAQHEFVIHKNKYNNPNKKPTKTLDNTLHRFSNPNSTTITRSSINLASNYLFDKNTDGSWFIMPEALIQLAELEHVLIQLTQAVAQPELHIKRYTFVSFHQSYGYEEFVEGIRPHIDQQSKQLQYDVQQGAFLQLCQQAQQDPHHTYAFFIDEINRANVSRVFGELLTLIESDKRAGMPNETQVKLAYSGKAFSVPANVNIYATMNLADRSLTPLDSAMRRRFEFIETPPQPQLLTDKLADLPLNILFKALNLRISAIIGQDYQLGHAKFLSITTITELNALMATYVIPALQEYCFNDWHNVRLILADEDKPIQTQFIIENTMVGLLDLPCNQPVFEINPNIYQFTQASYLPIYHNLQQTPSRQDQ